MRKISLLSLICILIFCLSSCIEYPEFTTDSVFALDTVITVKANQENAEKNINETWDLIAGLDKMLSRTDETGDLFAFNLSEGMCGLPDELGEVITESVILSLITGGAYDPTLAPVTDLWGITTDHPRVPSDDEIKEALSHCGTDKLLVTGSGKHMFQRADGKMKLDLGGSGKGYVCQRATELLSSHGGYGLVSFGSSIGVFGTKKDGSGWNIAITDPADPAKTLGFVTIPDGYISVSGDYERYAVIDGVRYCHIIDPRTGRPVDNGVHSVVVWNHDGLEGDVISTALFVLGEDGIETLKDAGFDFEALIISDRGRTMTGGIEKIITFFGENDG